MDEELREIFADEAGDLLDVIESGLLDLEMDPGNQELINQVFRATHTLKGNAQLLELTPLGHFAHLMEEVLDHLRDGSLTLSPDLNSLLLNARDALVELVGCALEGREQPPEQVAQVEQLLQRVLDSGTSGQPPAPEQPEPEQPAPAAEAETPPQPSAPVPAPPSCGGALSGGGRILLIHDVGVIRQLVMRYLSMTDLGEAAVDVATSSGQGVEKLQQEAYDVVLCGLETAGLTGLEVHQALRRSGLNHDTPFIVITSTDTPENRRRLQEQGIEHILIAPFTPSQLGEKVSQVFAPGRRRQGPRFGVSGTGIEIHQEGAKVSGQVINLCQMGVLCLLDHMDQAVDFMQPCRLSLTFPPRYGHAVLEDIAARLVKLYVLEWGEDDRPRRVQAAWNFRDLPAPAVAVLKAVLSRAEREYRAAHAAAAGS